MPGLAGSPWLHWSPDGRAVVGTRFSLFAVNPDNGERAPVARSWKIPRDTSYRVIIPDGKWLYYLVNS